MLDQWLPRYHEEWFWRDIGQRPHPAALPAARIIAFIAPSLLNQSPYTSAVHESLALDPIQTSL